MHVQGHVGNGLLASTIAMQLCADITVVPCTSPRALSASSFGSKATLAEGGVFSFHVICTFCTLHIVGCHADLPSQLAAQNRSCSLTAVSIYRYHVHSK